MSDHLDRAVEAVSRAIHEHDANASMGGVQWPEWDDLNAEGQFAYVPVAKDVLEALDEAGLLASPERDKGRAEAERLRAGIEALAEWWQRIPSDGGYEVACEDHARQALALLNPTEGDRDV